MAVEAIIIKDPMAEIEEVEVAAAEIVDMAEKTLILMETKLAMKILTIVAMAKMLNQNSFLLLIRCKPLRHRLEIGLINWNRRKR